MSEATELGKIVEFLLRTDMLAKMKETGIADLNDGTFEMIELIMDLPLRHNWNVDDAVEHFQDIVKMYSLSMADEDFDRDWAITRLYHNSGSADQYTLEEFNERFFKMDLTQKPFVQKLEDPAP